MAKYVFEPCDKTITVMEGDSVVRLGSEKTNGLLFAITYEDRDIFSISPIISVEDAERCVG